MSKVLTDRGIFGHNIAGQCLHEAKSKRRKKRKPLLMPLKMSADLAHAGE